MILEWRMHIVSFLNIIQHQKLYVFLLVLVVNLRILLNCIKHCENNVIPYGILTGFSITNKARSIANSALWDYHINSRDYGIVECVHQIFLHGVV
jgi:hypothetical protein